MVTKTSDHLQNQVISKGGVIITAYSSPPHRIRTSYLEDRNVEKD
jgi:hypothetical protein